MSEEGLKYKVKLDIYKQFGKSVEFKKHLHRVCDAESKSSMHDLSEQLGRHRRRKDK